MKWITIECRELGKRRQGSGRDGSDFCRLAGTRLLTDPPASADSPTDMTSIEEKAPLLGMSSLSLPETERNSVSLQERRGGTSRPRMPLSSRPRPGLK